MDTDDLSIPTYKGIILEAESFHHDLTLQFGMLASECKNDDNYLDTAEELINDWINEIDIDDLLEEIFYGQEIDRIALIKTLEKILSNIREIRKTPMDSCKYDFL